MRHYLLTALALAGGLVRADASHDVVVYGSSPAALTAAIEARNHGKTAIIVCPETRIGGLTTGGLGQTDIGNKSAFGGLALQFYRDVADYYKDEANWKYEKRSDYVPDGQCAGSLGTDSMWTFEPSAALKILEGWEKKHRLTIVRGEFLDRRTGGVQKDGARIVSFKTLSGRTFAGKIFVDATYEGDLLAAAGVSYTVGREPNARYGETISGVARRLSTHHQFNPGVSAYVKPGDPSSGLLPYVEPDTDEPDGAGDARVQAYCFRMCLTDEPSNRIPFVKPTNYDPLNFELLLRNLEAIPASTFAEKKSRPWEYMPWINSRMPNRKTDTNNRTGFSTDFVGQNWAWPEASYEVRAQLLKAHLDYQMGLMWTLANDPRVPAPIRTEVAKWGTCRDEFQDGLGNGWQSQLYVREGRRMIGDYVMTEKNCRHLVKAPRPVAMGAYTMDSHNCRRYVDKDGFVRNEGNIEDYETLRLGPYPIDYGALVPQKRECANLFVPVCLSASHMAFGSIRMEPVFFALGQVAGAAAALSIDDNCAVQDLDYARLRAVLLAEGQVIEGKAKKTR
ncbi:MAG: FAD-dependent oxidoreductase [Kiritimatiellia bacterium]